MTEVGQGDGRSSAPVRGCRTLAPRHSGSALVQPCTNRRAAGVRAQSGSPARITAAGARYLSTRRSSQHFGATTSPTPLKWSPEAMDDSEETERAGRSELPGGQSRPNLGSRSAGVSYLTSGAALVNPACALAARSAKNGRFSRSPEAPSQHVEEASTIGTWDTRLSGGDGTVSQETAVVQCATFTGDVRLGLSPRTTPREFRHVVKPPDANSSGVCGNGQGRDDDLSPQRVTKAETEMAPRRTPVMRTRDVRQVFKSQDAQVPVGVGTVGACRTGTLSPQRLPRVDNDITSRPVSTVFACPRCGETNLPSLESAATHCWAVNSPSSRHRNIRPSVFGELNVVNLEDVNSQCTPRGAATVSPRSKYRHPPAMQADLTNVHSPASRHRKVNVAAVVPMGPPMPAAQETGQRSTNHPRGALGRSLSPEASVPNQGVGAQKPNLGVVRPPLPIRPEAVGEADGRRAGVCGRWPPTFNCPQCGESGLSSAHIAMTHCARDTKGTGRAGAATAPTVAMTVVAGRATESAATNTASPVVLSGPALNPQAPPAQGPTTKPTLLAGTAEHTTIHDRPQVEASDPWNKGPRASSQTRSSGRTTYTCQVCRQMGLPSLEHAKMHCTITVATTSGSPARGGERSSLFEERGKGRIGILDETVDLEVRPSLSPRLAVAPTDVQSRAVDLEEVASGHLTPPGCVTTEQSSVNAQLTTGKEKGEERLGMPDEAVSLEVRPPLSAGAGASPRLGLASADVQSRAVDLQEASAHLTPRGCSVRTQFTESHTTPDVCVGMEQSSAAVHCNEFERDAEEQGKDEVTTDAEKDDDANMSSCKVADMLHDDMTESTACGGSDVVDIGKWSPTRRSSASSRSRRASSGDRSGFLEVPTLSRRELSSDASVVCEVSSHDGDLDEAHRTSEPGTTTVEEPTSEVPCGPSDESSAPCTARGPADGVSGKSSDVAADAQPFTTQEAEAGLEYFSTTFMMWIPTQVIAEDLTKGAVQLDVKPGLWLTVADLFGKLRLTSRGQGAPENPRSESQPTKSPEENVAATGVDHSTEAGTLRDKRPGLASPQHPIPGPAFTTETKAEGLRSFEDAAAHCQGGRDRVDSSPVRRTDTVTYVCPDCRAGGLLSFEAAMTHCSAHGKGSVDCRGAGGVAPARAADMPTPTGIPACVGPASAGPASAGPASAGPAPAPAFTGPAQVSPKATTRPAPLPQGEAVAYNERGEPTIVRQVEPKTGAARTIVQEEDGAHSVFGRSTLNSLMSSGEDDAAKWLGQLTNLQVRGLVHEMGRVLIERSQLYQHDQMKLEKIAQRANYSFFGLQETATEKELDNAYRKMAKRMHPDKNGGTSEAKSRFQNMKEKYEVLKKAFTAAAPPPKNEPDEPQDTTEKKDPASGCQAPHDSEATDTTQAEFHGDGRGMEANSEAGAPAAEEPQAPSRREVYDEDEPLPDKKEKKAEQSKCIEYDPTKRDSLDETTWKMLRQLKALESSLEQIHSELKRNGLTPMHMPF